MKLHVLVEHQDVLGNELFVEILLKFSGELSNHAQNMGRKFDTNNLSGISLAAHKLAGSAALFGVTRLHSSLMALEKAARKNATKDAQQCFIHFEAATREYEFREETLADARMRA